MVLISVLVIIYNSVTTVVPGYIIYRYVDVNDSFYNKHVFDMHIYDSCYNKLIYISHTYIPSVLSLEGSHTQA